MNKYQHRINELGGRFVYENVGELPVELSEEELQSVEAALGHPLPPDYREFLRDFGGYWFYGISYPLRRTSPYVPEGYLGSFYGLRIGPTLDILARHEDDLASQVIGPEMLPIARDAADNQICLFLSGPQKGSVHFWYAEGASSPFNYGNLYQVADSFDDFMQLIKKVSD